MIVPPTRNSVSTIFPKNSGLSFFAVGGALGFNFLRTILKRRPHGFPVQGGNKLLSHPGLRCFDGGSEGVLRRTKPLQSYSRFGVIPSSACSQESAPGGRGKTPKLGDLPGPPVHRPTGGPFRSWHGRVTRVFNHAHDPHGFLIQVYGLTGWHRLGFRQNNRHQDVLLHLPKDPAPFRGATPATAERYG